MLEKHKKIIEKYALEKKGENNSNVGIGGINKYSFAVFKNELNINMNENITLKNIDNNDINIWKIKEGNRESSIIINKVNSLDVVAMIAIIDCNKAFLTIKQTPTNMYISYNDESIGYNINKVSRDLIINIIEDYFNKKRFLCNINKSDIFKFIRVDIDDIFTTIEKNKEYYINNLNHQLNNLNAKYVIESKKIKKKLKTIKDYKI